MNKAVLISIRPEWINKIFNGGKTIEIRKTRPKLETPFKCYIYCTQSVKYSNGKNIGNIWINRGTENRYIGNGKIVGEFVCDEIIKFNYYYCDGCEIDDDTLVETMLGREEVNIYANGNPIFCWHISSLKIYDEPKYLQNFKSYCGTKYDCCCCKWFERGLMDCICVLKRPPQSWCYVEEKQ